MQSEGVNVAAVEAAAEALRPWAQAAGPRGAKLAVDLGVRVIETTTEGATQGVRHYEVLDVLAELAEALGGAANVLRAAAELLDGPEFTVEELADALRQVAP